MRAQKFVVALGALSIAVCYSLALSEGLPPGNHTPVPKYWPKIQRFVTNYTPLEFNYRIGNLTPGLHNDLWFSIGPSIERIDATGRITDFRMPHWLWRVSGIAAADGRIIFSAGQSGKIGIIEGHDRLRFIQVVARRDFPDITDLVVERSGDIWFLDRGRQSIGHRSPTGKVIEEPVPAWEDVWSLRRCAGKLWISYGGMGPDHRHHAGAGIVRPDLAIDPYPMPSTAEAESGCDSFGRLWLAAQDRPNSATRVMRLDGRSFAVPAKSIAQITSDRAGGVWATAENQNEALGDTGLLLVHINANDVMKTYDLSHGMLTVGAPIAQSRDGSIWLGVNEGGSPIAVTRLSLTSVAR